MKRILNRVLTGGLGIEEAARSVAIGAFIALSPSFGIQLFLTAILWNIFRDSGRLRFNLPIAISLTFITNIFTVAPYYFFCYCTGIVICNNVNSIIDYAEFTGRMFPAAGSVSLSGIMKIMPDIFKPLITGAFFYSVIVSVSLYMLSYSYLKRIRKRIKT